MRFLRDPRAMDRDEQWGLVSPRPLAPTIRRSRKRFRLPPPALHRVNTLGYVCWLLFLVFWIVFGRATLFFYMTTAGFAPTNGLELDLFPTALTRAQVVTA